MSNLWKALRDVSREGDPTVDYETPSLMADDEISRPPRGTTEAPVPTPNQAGNVGPDPQFALTRRSPAPARPRPPLSASTGPASEAPSDAELPKPRLAPLQSSLRRTGLANGLPFDGATSSLSVTRPRPGVAARPGLQCRRRGGAAGRRTVGPGNTRR
jgi:hypothetical protein